MEGAEGPWPTFEQTVAMQDLVRQGLEEGALGLTVGYAQRHETFDALVEVTRPAAEAGAIYASHIRSEGGGLLQAVAEAIEVAHETGIAVQISHLKANGPAHWGKLEIVLAMMEDAVADLMAAWEVEAIDVALEIERRNAESRIGAVGFTMSEDNLRRILAHPLVMIGTDAHLEVFGERATHPRNYGTYPRVLGRYVREEAIMSLGAATDVAARRAEVPEVGVLPLDYLYGRQWGPIDEVRFHIKCESPRHPPLYALLSASGASPTMMTLDRDETTAGWREVVWDVRNAEIGVSEQWGKIVWLLRIYAQGAAFEEDDGIDLYLDNLRLITAPAQDVSPRFE